MANMQELPEQSQLSISFWGVRGSITVADANRLTTGGDTACVEMRCGPHVLLFDAGSGLRRAGLALAAAGVGEFDIFLSHWHYDHVIGLPFFAPLMALGTKATLWAGHLDGGMSAEAAVASLMRAPFFPITPQAFRASLIYRDFAAGDVLKPRHGIIMRTAKLTHPGGVIAYRVEYQGKVSVYMTDVAHHGGSVDAAAVALAEGADLVIYDCMYTDEEFARHAGYGHSTWQQGIRLCRAAGARKLAMFHHAPERSDDALAEIERQARGTFAGAFAARSGMTLTL